MAPNPTSSAVGSPGSRNDASAAMAAAKKEKRVAVAAAAMAPRMQSQVQKWAKMTAELGGSGSGGDDGTAGGDSDEDDDATQDASRPRKKARMGATTTDRTRTKKAKRREQDNLPYAKQLRAPHRRDRYVSFGIGTGLSKKPTGQKATATTATSSFPPTCLLCLVRFESRQQLRDHESLSSWHKRQLRDPEARKIAFRRYSKIADDEAAVDAAAAGSKPGKTEDDTEMTDQKDQNTTRTAHRPPIHIKRLPRRRGDLAPSYISYAIPVRAIKPEDNAEVEDADAAPYHACLLCKRRFRSRAMLRLHERESALHRARTRDPASVSAAVIAVNKASTDKAETKEGGESETAPPSVRPLLRMRPAAPSTTGTTSAQYRDRARERRLAFGGGNKGSPKTSGKKDAASTPAAAPSKGAALLSKMGWTAGQGLGVQGGGVKEAIAPTVYRSGVGLGAQGGKLGDAADVAARRTESSYADFVQQTRDTARQRLMALDLEEAEAAEAAVAEAEVKEY
ncbi:hypothetical protein SEUCBS139899_009387 [Sporothrix eucalyptigena]